MADFRNSRFMYLLGGIVVCFVLIQSTFFIVRAWRQAKQLGISNSTLKNTVISSAMFTLAPALSILATVISLSYALGIVIPWIRLSLIGNLSYEAVAAESALGAFGIVDGLQGRITDPTVFTAVIWVMTLGIMLSLFLIPFVLRGIQKRMGKVAEKNGRWADLMSTSAFIGIIAAFIARALAGASSPGSDATGAGFLSIATLLTAVFCMLGLQKLCQKKQIAWLEPFAMPLSMFLAMGVSILCSRYLPDSLVGFEWSQLRGAW